MSSDEIEKAQERLLLEWINELIGTGKKGFSGEGLARALKLNPSQASRIRSGKRPIKLAEVPVIEGYFGQRAPIYGATNANTTVARQLASAVLIKVTFVIAPGVWREAGTTMAIAEQIASVPDERLAGLRQYACSIEADPQRFVICVPYTDIRTRHQAGDVVHVVRRQGKLEEHTLQKVRKVGANYYLAPEKAANNQKDGLIALSHKDKDLEIRGLVVADHIKRKF